MGWAYQVDRILAAREREGNLELSVKPKERPFREAVWVPEEDLRGSADEEGDFGLNRRITNFKEAYVEQGRYSPEGTDARGLRPEWKEAHRIIGARAKEGREELLVKWRGLDYSETTWEDGQRVRGEFPEKARAFDERAPIADQAKKMKAQRRFQHFKETPNFLAGGHLQKHQLEGTNWLRDAWRSQKSVILADEMGLGKTIQALTFLADTFRQGNAKPHLVVAPLQTLENWQAEAEKWVPHLNVVILSGDNKTGRPTVKNYELDEPKRPKFHVLITSFDLATKQEQSFIRKFDWGVLIADEGHRVKSESSRSFQALTSFSSVQRVLLTGTPLQNTLMELFVLMKFLHPERFADFESFQEQYPDLGDSEQVEKLRAELQPYMLQRRKRDVLQHLPAKKEVVVPVTLTKQQREFYRLILTKQYEVLQRGNKARTSTLNNIVVELRKCCGTTYLCGQEVPEHTLTEQELSRSSGKIELLSKMLRALKRRGRRVLVFCQFVTVMDILEELLDSMGLTYSRLDGTMSNYEKQESIRGFNSSGTAARSGADGAESKGNGMPSDDSEEAPFCFLISTRAGGLGVNLATADTVILFDNDWNPQNDLQAQARAHRIGQTNDVLVYRLVTRGTVEERIVQMQREKQALSHAVLRSGEAKEERSHIEHVLRHGAKELFEEDDSNLENKRIHWDEAAVEKLLDQKGGYREGREDDGLEAGLDLSVAHFEQVEEPEDANGDVNGEESANGEGTAQDGSKFWNELLKERYQEEQRREAEEKGKGKRKRVLKMNWDGTARDREYDQGKPQNGDTDKVEIGGDEEEDSDFKPNSLGEKDAVEEDDEDDEGKSKRRKTESTAELQGLGKGGEEVQDRVVEQFVRHLAEKVRRQGWGSVQHMAEEPQTQKAIHVEGLRRLLRDALALRAQADRGQQLNNVWSSMLHNAIEGAGLVNLVRKKLKEAPASRPSGSQHLGPLHPEFPWKWWSFADDFNLLQSFCHHGNCEWLAALKRTSKLQWVISATGSSEGANTFAMRRVLALAKAMCQGASFRAGEEDNWSERALSRLPGLRRLVLEAFTDESGVSDVADKLSQAASEAANLVHDVPRG